MGSRWQLRVPRSEGERVCDPVRGVIHNMHRIALPLPRTPTPCYRHLFLTGRGGLTDNGIHLNLPPGLSNQPGPPQADFRYHDLRLAELFLQADALPAEYRTIIKAYLRSVMTHAAEKERLIASAAEPELP